jgi:trk system potassium uptake protein TrkA
MHVVIGGAGKLGRHLADVFGKAGHHVSIIGHRPVDLEEAAISPNVSTVLGDLTTNNTLRLAAIDNAAVFVACTSSDEANMLACYLAKFEFGVKRVIARVNDPRNEHMFTEQYGCDAAVSYADIMGRMVLEESTYADVVTLLKLRQGKLVIIEGEVHENSSIAGKTLAQASVPENIVIVAIIRGDDTLIARGQTQILAGDRLLALMSEESQDVFKDVLRN